MAEAFKILGQADLSATTLTDVYTVPAATQTIVSTVVVCNRNADLVTVRVSVAVAGAADDPKQYLYYDTVIPANDSMPLALGLSLGAGDKVRVYASGTGISVNIFGVELT